MSFQDDWKKEPKEKNTRNISLSISEKLNDPFAMRSYQRRFMILLVILAPMLWFGFEENFSLSTFFDLNYGAVTFIFSLGAFYVGKVSRESPFDKAYQEDEELQGLAKKAKGNGETITEKDPTLKISSEWIQKTNEEEQQRLNETKTQAKISDLKRKSMNARLSGKEFVANEYDHEITRYKNNLAFDNSFVPYHPDTLIYVSDNTDRWIKKLFNRERKGNARLKSDPTKANYFSEMFKGLFRGATAGAPAITAFTLNMTFIEMLKFYAVYAIVLLIAFLFNYPKVVAEMQGWHKQALRNQIDMQEKLIKHIDKELAKPQKQIEHKTRRIKDTIKSPMKFKLIGGNA